MAGRHGIETSMKDPDVAVAMNVHPDDLSPLTSIHAVGNRRPPLHEAIRIGEFGWLWVLGLLGACRHPKHGDDDGGAYQREPHSTCARHRGSPGKKRGFHSNRKFLFQCGRYTARSVPTSSHGR